MCRQEQDAKTPEHESVRYGIEYRSTRTYTICCESGDGTPQSCTSAIPEMDFAFGSKNPTDVSQLAPLGVRMSNSLVSYEKKRKKVKEKPIN
ncbi:hypothetical protein CQZ94_06475 [Bacillus sp. MYb209]|nr:hypothetical protein CQZ94_06475 [Bacillus sp. MYb209]